MDKEIRITPKEPKIPAAIAKSDGILLLDQTARGYDGEQDCLLIPWKHLAEFKLALEECERLAHIASIYPLE